MIQQYNRTKYRAFGHSIQSDVPLPELKQLDSASDDIDISIQYADLSEDWLKLSSSSSRAFINTENQVMFKVPGLAIFAATNGNTILISPDTGADEDKMRLYILGTCMGAILLQRKILPLHGSAIVIDDKAYAFVGLSGHGKSTLASAFLQQGYRLLTDDVIAVTLDHRGVPYVSPAYPQQKLWQESLDVFGMDSNRFHPLFDRETKYAIPVSAQFAESKLPLSGIFEIMKTDGHDCEIHAVHKLERLPLLYRHTYRNLFLYYSGLTKWHFEFTARMAGSIDVYRLQRPQNKLTVHRLTEMVLEAIAK